MNLSGSTPNLTHSALAQASPTAATADNLFGAAVVCAFASAAKLVHWIVGSHGWIFFFLVTRPLFDLTWRWRFFEFSEQGVNIQTFVGLIVLAANSIAIVAGARSRGLPRNVMAFLCCATFSILVSPSSWGFNELVRLFAGATFFYTAGPLLADARRFESFAKGLLLTAAVPVFLSYLQFAGILPYDYWDWIDGVQTGRVSGTYPTPLSLVFLMIYALPLAMYLAGAAKGYLTKGFARCFLIAASISIAFTYHRVGYIVIALEGLIWLYLTRGKKAVLALCGVLIVGVALSSAWLTALYGPLGQALAGNADLSSAEFLRGRGFQWFLYLNSFVSSGPFHWVFGNGGSVIADLDPNVTYILSPNEPHSDYIRILHAYGILGFVLYLSIFGKFFLKAVRQLRSADPFARVLGQLMLPMLAAFALLSVTTEPLRYPGAAWYLFAIGAALFCLKEPVQGMIDGSQALAIPNRTGQK